MSESKKRGRKHKATTTDNSQRTLLTHFTRSKTGTVSSSNPLDGPTSSAADIATDATSPVLDIDSSPALQAVPLASVDNIPTAESGTSNYKQNGLKVAASQSSNGERPKRLFPLFQRKLAPGDGLYSDIASSDVNGRPSPPISSPVSPIHDLTSDNEGSEEAPIVIDSSPVQPPKRAMHRSSSLQLLDTPSLPARKRRKLDMLPDAPFPDRSSQHVPSSRSVHTSSASHLLPRRASTNRGPHTPEPVPPKAPQFPSISLQSTKASSDALADSPTDVDLSIYCKLYPGIARLFDHAHSSGAVDNGQQQTWAEKWRPRRAEEVLGNEWAACYLRDWMDALRLHYTAPPTTTPPGSQPSGDQSKGKGGKKGVSRDGSLRGSQGPRGSQARGTKRKAVGPTVVREVARKPKKTRRDLDDFMVSDDDDDGLTDATESAYTGVDFGDDNQLGMERGGSFAVDPSAPPEGVAPVPSTPFVFGGAIRNTMLLVGPPGSGKTAAVYACAEELGWTVFEVHPGIGRRGAAQLDALVGDVGKNHTLAPATTQSTATNVFSMLSRENKPQNDSIAETEPSIVKVAPTQSVILFEEVDVMFGEDASFWSALIAFIKESRRPVVLTCNDVSLVPTMDLPLERVVHFKRPSAALAHAVVRGVCVAEGRRVPRAAAMLSTRVGGVDLRQALHQSQLGFGLLDHAHVDGEVGGDRSRGHHGMLVDHTLFEPADTIEGQHPRLEALRQAERQADGACFVDAYLARPDQSALTMLELAEPHADDEVGLHSICIARRHTAPVGDAFYSAHEEVARAVGWSEEGEGSEENGERYIDRLVTVLEKSRVPGDRLADRKGLVLDYGPWLREIGKVEEADAAAAAVAETASGRRGLRGRQTMNSTGRRAVVGERWGELEATGLEFGMI
ncbi:unnamed protein product [Peniophora sp. CBMAI 1063]|nr:unnamed protein product [Peniophora sp. CBMAI 1063]